MTDGSDVLTRPDGDDIIHPCDRALLVLYGEDDGSAHDTTACGPCRMLLDQASEALGFYRDHRPAPTPLPAGPSPEVLRHLPRRRIRLGALVAAAGLLLLAAAGTMEGTRPSPAFALTDREIFWSLSFLNTDLDAVRSRPLWYQEPFLDDLVAPIRRAAEQVELIEPDPWPLSPTVPARETGAAWEDLAPDALQDAIESLHRRIDETRLEMEDWI